MKIVSTFHPPTSVTHSLKCCLTPNVALEHLVVAKINQLEVYALLPEGPKLECAQEIWGRVTSLKAVTRQASPHQYLLLTLDHPDPRIITLDYIESSSIPGQFTLVTISSENLHERSRPAEFFVGAVVDPTGNIVAVSSYPGKLRIIELEDGLLKSSSDIPVREYNLLSACFLHTPNLQNSCLAMLYFDHTQKLMLSAYDVKVEDTGPSFESSTFFPSLEVQDQDAFLIIPVPPNEKDMWSNRGGILALGGSDVLYYPVGTGSRGKAKKRANSDDMSRRRKATTQARWPLSEVAAWTQVDEGRRFLIGDNFGQLALLAVSLETPKLTVLTLGAVSPPTSLTPISSQYIFVGSHYGDSQIVRITPEKSIADGSYLEVMESYKNIAPILDAVAIYPGNDDEPQIVTCSGGKSSGSLRIIKSGVNFIEDAELSGLTNVTGLWPLKSRHGDQFHTYVLVSTPLSTQMLQLLSDNHAPSNSWFAVTDEMFSGVVRDSRTLAAGNMAIRTKDANGKSSYKDGPYVAQVTTKSVVLLNMAMYHRETQWCPPNGQEIVAASINASQICVAQEGGIVSLLVPEGDKIIVRASLPVLPVNGAARISSVTVNPMVSSKYFSLYVAIAFFGSHEIKLCVFKTLEEKDRAVVPHLPCSLRFHDFAADTGVPKPYLIAGLVDGSVAVIPFDGNELGVMRIVSIGDQPIYLTLCFLQGKEALMATGRRSSVLHWAKDSLQHSPVLMKDALFATYINSKESQSAIVAVSHSSIIIGRIQNLDKIHIRTILMGSENPVRIAHHPRAGVLGVGCHFVRPAHFGEVELSASFKILDDASFETYSNYTLEDNEQITAVNLVKILVEGSQKDCFAVGTMFYHREEREPTRGRLLIFAFRSQDSSQASRQPYLLAEADMKGCVYAAVSLEGKVAVAINTGVYLYGIESSSEIHGATRLVVLAEWNHNYVLTSLAVRDGILVAGDILYSVAALQIVDSKLQTVARHYTPLMPVCLGVSEDKSIVGANNDGNLFSFKMPSEGTQPKLDQDGCYRLDDNVNTLLPARGGKQANSKSLVRQQYFFTAAGRIGVISRIDDARALHLTELERNLSTVVSSLGGMDHATQRAPANARGRSEAHNGAYGFLDGDFLERFLDYPDSSADMQAILTGQNEAEKLSWTNAQYTEILEELQSLH